MIKIKLTATLAAAALALLALGASSASGDFGIVPGTYSSTLSATGAGAHPDYTTSFALNTHLNTDGFNVPDGHLHSILAKLPPGLVGNPQAYPQCSAEFATVHRYCPAATQIGVLKYTLAGFPLGYTPVYNMQAQSGRIAELGFVNIRILLLQIHLLPSLRTGSDYGIDASAPALPSILALVDQSLTIWGVPADPSHDGERGFALFGAGGCLGPNGPNGKSCPSNVPPRPYLSNPTQCETPVATDLTIDSWQNPGDFLTYPGDPQQLTGCEDLPFHPSISLQPTSHEAGGPTGVNVDLHLPQPWVDNPQLPATPHLRKAVVTLPEGMSVNPAQAEGLGACSEAQIGFKGFNSQAQRNEFTPDPATCPDSSKIGTVEVDTPLLPDPVPGSLYLAKQGENPFGSLLAMYLVAEGSGARIKLPGKIEVDPGTGRITTTFDQNPQLPFEDLHLHLHLFGGQRAALINPPSCGTHTSTAALTSWADPTPVSLQSSFQLTSGPDGSPCGARPFKPGFEAGTVTPMAGAFSPFVLKLSREDGSQELAGLQATLPPGLLGRLTGVAECSQAAIDAAKARIALGDGALEAGSPSCPAASRLGKVNVGVGVGSPFYVGGTAYLAGPYKGAPLSLAIVTPALAGPFDLGTVVVRTALRVDPETARITAVSDPIPHILYGIPLDVRSVNVTMDRPDFTVNPTSCNPMSVTGTATSLEGATAQLSNRFQVGACAALPFKPHLTLKLKGGTHRGDNPALRATLTMPPGSANIARTQVALPHSEFLDQAHIRTVCTRVQFAASSCPAGSIYGHARAFTPLLDQPLEGPVYLRSSDNPLPDLVADLNGQIHIVLDGRIDSKRGGIRTTFATVPDAPVSKFVLTMKGGKKGLLQNSTDLCARPQRASVQIDAHSGKLGDSRPLLRSDCGGKRHKRKR